LAVGVGRQVNDAGPVGLALQLGEDVLGGAAVAVPATLAGGAVHDDVAWLPAAGDAHADDLLVLLLALGRQVADVAVTGQHEVAGAQVLVDGLGLGRRLDDDEVHRAAVAR